MNTLQGTNISHLGKRKIIFKTAFVGDMLVPWRVDFGNDGKKDGPFKLFQIYELNLHEDLRLKKDMSCQKVLAEFEAL